MRLFVVLTLLAFTIFGLAISARSEVMSGDPLMASRAFSWQDDYGFQLRVEQRIIIRIPRSAGLGLDAQASNGRTLQSVPPSKMKEKKIGKCLWIDKLAGSRPGNSKDQTLEFVSKDGQLFRAYLGKGCLAREFYAGTYIERAKDGKICADRDLVHARTGAKCEIDKIRLLVAGK